MKSNIYSLLGLLTSVLACVTALNENPSPPVQRHHIPLTKLERTLFPKQNGHSKTQKTGNKNPCHDRTNWHLCY